MTEENQPGIKKLWEELKANPDKPFPPLQNDLFLRTLRGEKTDKAPIWVHRQAGRYMKEYHDVRSKHDFFAICRNPTVACEVTLQPIKAFDLDASIIFSDILVIPQALGLEVQMVKGKGPVLPQPITYEEDANLERLNQNVDVNKELGYVFEAITLTRHALEGKVPLIGFSGAPWTLFSYMVEGQGSKTWSKALRFLYKYPKLSHQILSMTTDVVIDYLCGQAKAGAQALEVFDSWSGILPPPLFKQFCLPYVSRICEEVKARCLNELGYDVPMTLFAKGSNLHLKVLSEIGYDCLSVDSRIPPRKARDLVGNDICLQGNLEPCALYASEEDLRQLVANMLDSFGPGRHVVNLGHGMLPTHDPKKLAVFIDAVHNHQYSATPTSKKTPASQVSFQSLVLENKFLFVGVAAALMFQSLRR